FNIAPLESYGRPFLKKGLAKNFNMINYSNIIRQYRIILSADTASEVRQMPSQKRRSYWILATQMPCRSRRSGA
ncbi:MAG: hypothetical protein U0O46_10665, partial [Gemmiger qucibialis]